MIGRKTAFLGGGKMGEALISGLIRSGVQGGSKVSSTSAVSTPSTARTACLASSTI